MNVFPGPVGIVAKENFPFSATMHAAIVA